MVSDKVNLCCVLMSSLIGKHLQGGKYKLDAVLGRGGFGLTFRAHQTFLDQVVVVKTLHESFWTAPNLSDLQRQFQDEARRLAMCSHPNVVRVSDFFVEDRLPYMVMDYIPGRSLSDIVLPENPLPLAAAVNYIQQIGRALQVVHSKGLLHRDVKPQNIMIHQLTGEAVLIDFGIARELTPNPAQTHTSIVSEGYAPIEQYLPKAHRSAATDVYGLAATLYTLLTAQVPVASVLRDRTPLTPIQQLRPDVKAGVLDALTQGMAVELKDRPQSVGRWLTLLEQPSQKSSQNSTQKSSQKSQRTGFFGRGDGADDLPAAGLSEMPTQVVVPRYRSNAEEERSQRTAIGKADNRTNHPTNYPTNAKTVVAPIPDRYVEEKAVYRPPAAQVAKPKGQGCGCVPPLLLLTVAAAGLFVGNSLWRAQQFPDDLLNPPIETPTEAVPEAPTAEPEPTEPPAIDSSETDGPEDPAANNSEEDELNNEPEAGEDDKDPQKPKDPKSGEPPLLLEDSGNPENPQPNPQLNPPADNPANNPANDSEGAVPVPGFPPGTPEGDIQQQLGTPTQKSSRNGFRTSLYTLVPNRITLAYAYAPDSGRVQQSEAAFSPSSDRLMMRATLLGMLDGRSTSSIEAGLEAVRTGDRDRFDFKKKGFTGTIERNSNGYVHIYVKK